MIFFFFRNPTEMTDILEDITAAISSGNTATMLSYGPMLGFVVEKK